MWGWTKEPVGASRVAGVDSSKIDLETFIPNGMVWNMTYDPAAGTGEVGTVTEEELWGRLET